MKTAMTTPISQANSAERPQLIPDLLKPVLKIDHKERARQRDVLRAREYFEGRQGAKLTERLRQWLGEDEEFSLNFSATIVTAIAERLLLDAKAPLKSEADTPSVEGSANAEETKQDRWIKRAWRDNRLGWKQFDIHEAAVRDGEYFLIADWDNDNARPRFTPHKRYTDPDVKFAWGAGDGEGVRMFYPNNDINQKPLFAAKRWVETLDNGQTEKRITLYFSHQVLTYRHSLWGWTLLNDDENGTVAWVDPATQQPLGIPVVVWRNPGLRPESKRVWPLQRAMNKIFLDLMQICDASAFRIWLFFGWEPKDKEGKPLVIAPNRWIGDAGRKPEEATATPVEGTSPQPVGDFLDGLIMKMASLTDTPASRLLMTRQVAAEGTLKQQSEPLISKCRRRAAAYGAAWEDVFNIARRLENAFGSETLDETVLLSAEWEPFETRAAEDELKELEVEEKKVEIQILKGQRGVSQKQSQRELEYTDKQIAQMQDERADEQTNASNAFSKAFNAGQVG